MKLRGYALLFNSLLLLIVLGACSAHEQGPKLEAIVLDKEDITIEPGEKYDFKVKFTPADIAIEEIQLEWESSDTNVVTVSDGKLVGKEDGIATVTVKSSNGITASCFVTVQKPSAYDKLTGLDKKCMML